MIEMQIWMRKQNNTFFFFVKTIIFFASNSVALFSGIGLFLLTDSLIAFKSTILYCIGNFLMNFLKMFYQGARPFWVNSKIDTFYG